MSFPTDQFILGAHLCVRPKIYIEILASQGYADGVKLFDHLVNGTAAAVAGGLGKTDMIQSAIEIAFTNLMSAGIASKIGAIFVAVCLLFFAFSTILGWNLFGKINFEYLFGKKAVIVYSLLSLVFVFLGSYLKNDLVWELTDFFNYLMVIPNVIALFALSKLVRDESKEAAALKKAAKANK